MPGTAPCGKRPRNSTGRSSSFWRQPPRRPYGRPVRTRLAALAAIAAALLAMPSIASADTCLPAQGSIDATGVRGVHVGVRANIRDPDGKPLNVKKARYCVADGGAFSFALTREQDVVLVLSTSEGDAIGPINP